MRIAAGRSTNRARCPFAVSVSEVSDGRETVSHTGVYRNMSVSPEFAESHARGDILSAIKSLYPASRRAARQLAEKNWRQRSGTVSQLKWIMLGIVSAALILGLLAVV